MKLFKKMAQQQARMESKEPDPKERELARREQMKHKARESAWRDASTAQGEGGSGGNAKVQELIEARHRSDAIYEKKRQAIMARIGNGIDKHEAARQLKELEETWHAEQLAIKTRLREIDPSL